MHKSRANRKRNQARKSERAAKAAPLPADEVARRTAMYAASATEKPAVVYGEKPTLRSRVKAGRRGLATMADVFGFLFRGRI